MAEFTTPEEAGAALHDEQTEYDAIRYLVTSEVPEATNLLRHHLMNLTERSAEDVDDIIEALTKFFVKDVRRIVKKMETLGIIPTFAALMVFIGKANDEQAYVFGQWSKQQPIVTVYTIDDMREMCMLIDLVVNRSIPNMVSVGSAPYFEKSHQVELLQPDLLIVDHMLPGKDGFEVMEYYRDKLPESVFLLRSFRGRDDETVARGIACGADEVGDYGPLLHDQFTSYLPTVYNNHRKR